MDLVAWQLRVAEALTDPDANPFIASVPVLVVIGGRHTELDWCWCQPRMQTHGCGHRHGDHKEVMD